MHDLQQLARRHVGPPVEPGSISDRDFFLANPHRNYRLRLATQGEAARFEQQCGQIPCDWFVYAVTKQFFDGMRIRRYCVGLVKEDLSEEAAKEIFEWLEGVDSSGTPGVVSAAVITRRYASEETA